MTAKPSRSIFCTVSSATAVEHRLVGAVLCFAGGRSAQQLMESSIVRRGIGIFLAL